MASLLIVQLPAKMLNPIGDDQYLGIKMGIVACYLPPSLVINVNMGCLTLHKHQGLGQPVIHHDVGAVQKTIVLYSLLQPNQRLGVSKMTYQIVQKMLSYPFLRCQLYILLAHHVKNLVACLGRLDLIRKSRKVQGLHGANLRLNSFIFGLI